MRGRGRVGSRGSCGEKMDTEGRDDAWRSRRGGRDARTRGGRGGRRRRLSCVGEAGMRAAYSAGQGFCEFGTRTVETRA